MIYLIESAAFREINGKKEYFSILKIGYTRDEEKTSSTRFGAYRLHNPGCKVLYTIPELTDKDEKKLHKKFKKYKYSDYGNEWFSYDFEILDFFDRYSKLSFKDIRLELDNMFKEDDKEDFIHSNRPIVKLILAKILTSEECKRNTGVDNVLEDIYRSSTGDFSSLLEYIKEKYGENVIKEYEERMIVLESNPENKKIVEMYYKSTTQVSKLKVLCENKINEIILSNISDNDELKIYYKFLGPVKIKTLSYNITDIREEFNKRTFHDIKMYKEIFENNDFQVGSKIEKARLKEYFGNLYNKYGYKGSPKAIDIENYFNIKSALISIIENGAKKRVNGFEILGFNIESPYYKEYLNFLRKN